MKQNKIFILILTSLTITLCLLSLEAYAAVPEFFQRVAEKGTQTFRHTKGIILIVGGFGLIGIAYKAIFGKVKWDWMAGLSLGLFVLAATGAFWNYVAGNGTIGYNSKGAGGTDMFETMSDRAIDLATGMQQVAFALGGFGVIMFTFLAICGKINFKHLGYIFICMFMLSGTGLIISYMTGGAADESLGTLTQFTKPQSFVNSQGRADGGVGDTYTHAASSL